MKKLLIISISIMIILALASSVMAKAVKLDLLPFVSAAEGSGKVVLNNPSGAVNFIVQVNIKGAQANHPYVVWIYAASGGDFSEFPEYLDSGWYNLGELLTNKKGNGSFHINIALPETGLLSGIEVALNEVSPETSRQYSSEVGEIEIK